MRPIVKRALPLVVLGLASCMASKREPYNPYDESGAYSAKFSHYCETKDKDDFGDKAYKHCSIVVESADYRTPIGPIRMTYETLMLVDYYGIHLLRPKKAHPACAGTPQRISVDDQRVDHLPESAQVSAILNGKKLVWEQQSKWPYCIVAPYATSLDGLREQVDAAKAELAASK